MFGRLRGKGKQASGGGDRPLSRALETSILSVVGARGIPAMPAAAQRAFELSVDPNAEARDFVEIIESDEALSARVLKIANSVYFERGKKSETIEDSVMVIGNEELRNLLNATTLTEIFPSRHAARHQLWVNDIAAAVTARRLAQRLLPGKESSAFLGGLMHDIGKLLLLQRVGPDYNKVLDLVRGQGLSFCAAEEQVFVFNHTDVGRLIGDKWNFAPELLSVIHNHHAPWSAEELAGRDLTLVSIVRAANIIAHSLGLGHPRGFNRLQNASAENLEDVWKVLRVPSAEQGDLLKSVRKTFELEYDLYAQA